MIGKHKKKNQSISFLGRLIDQNIEDFKRDVEEQHINLGTLKNYILYFNSAYSDLVSRKNELIEGFGDRTEKEKRDIHKAVMGIYSELTKIEQKLTYLRERVDQLEKLPEGEIDTDFEK